MDAATQTLGAKSESRAGSGAVLALVSIAAFMVVLDTSVVSTSLSTIRTALGASLEQLEWVVNAYILVFAVLLMTAAALGDRFGRRRLFAVGIAVFTAASAACALAGSQGWLIAFRAVQGVGAALIMPLSVALLSASIPPGRRAKAMGVFSGVSGLAVLAGPAVGGAVSEGLAWQWIFGLNVPIGLLLLAALRRRIGESYGPNKALDFGGLSLAAGGALGLVWGLIRSGSVGFGSREVVASITAGLLCCLLFAVWEIRARSPMLPMRLFRSLAFTMGNAVNFLLYASLIGSLFFIAQYFQIAMGCGPLAAGLRMLPWTGTLFVLAPIAGHLAGRVGERPLIVYGLLLHTAGMVWIALIARPGASYIEFVAPLLISSCGLPFAMPTSMSAVIGAVLPGEIGKASGALHMLRQLGSVYGIAILAAVFAAHGSYASPASFDSGFAPALLASAGLSLAGALAGLALRGKARG